MKMQLRNVRLSFPHLFKPNPQFDSDKHTAMFIVPKDHPQFDELESTIEEVIDAKWPKRPKGLKVCLRDGSEKEDLDGFGGDVVFFNASNEARPTVLDVDGSPLAAGDGRPYAGCYVYAIVEFWAQDNEFGKRVNATLKGVKFFKDGDRFGGGGAADPDEFDDIEQTEEEDIYA